ncbi:unnamed protein product, partial [Trichobilharzia regenti]
YDVTVGYWRYSGDEEPAYKNLERHPSRVQDSLLEHLHVAIELWHYCTHLAHRSLTCYNSAFILLTLGISILFIIPFIATKEYRNCIISRVDSGKEHYHGKVVDVPYKGRYFLPTYTVDYHTFIGNTVTGSLYLLFVILPGIKLLVSNRNNL